MECPTFSQLLEVSTAGKKRDLCQHLTLFLWRIRDVTWTTEFRNTRYACKSQGDTQVFYQLFEWSF